MTPAHIMVLSDISIMTSKLETLSLRYCEGLSEVAVQAILGTTHTLKTFRVEYCSLKDNELFRVVERVVEYNPSLEELDVRGNYCGDLSLQTIANCMGRPESKLTVLHISDPLDGHEHDSDDDSRETWYNARDFSVLANAIKISNRIRQLTIRCKVPATQYEGLVNTLLRCPTIEKLHLSNNESSTLNFESIDLESLVHDVKTSCSLKELCLSKTPLSEAEPLFRVLSQCPKLEVLRLHRVGLKRLDFSTSFAKPSPCPLRCLSLRGNSFEHDLRLDNNEHENVIIDVLQANPMLSSLHFNNTGKRRDTIENYQHMNWAGRMLLGNDKVPQSLWPMVIKRVNKHRHWKMADKANAIYGLLRDSDTLMCDH
jgi:Leucine-rich repeat (LRR) protein